MKDARHFQLKALVHCLARARQEGFMAEQQKNRDGIQKVNLLHFLAGEKTAVLP